MSGERVGVVVFPGTNCEQDCERALKLLGAEPVRVWHQQTSLPDVDLLILPGGFAHGDYLRTGAIARFSPIMDAIVRHAESGGYVLGICNGFQILCEAGLLPGALVKNAGLKFLCRWVDLRVDNTGTPFTSRAEPGQVLRVPINHFEGNFYCGPDALAELRDQNRIVLRYVDNPNGSVADIAGIANQDFNVFGMMPHPERACEALLGSVDGAVILGSILDRIEPARVGA